MIVYTKDHNYQDITKKGLVIVDFYATWCGPCQSLLPELETLSQTTFKGIPMYKINIDEFKPLAVENGVRSVPTVIVYRDGKEEQRTSGFEQALELLENLKF